MIMLNIFDLKDPDEKPNPWRNSLRLLSMASVTIASVFGFSRAFNTIMRKGAMFELDFPAYLPPYLIISGVIILILGLAAYLGLRDGRSWQIPVLWASTLTTIALVWLEKLVLWLPDQAGGSLVVPIIAHLIWLLVVSLYTAAIRKRDRDESGD